MKPALKIKHTCSLSSALLLTGLATLHAAESVTNSLGLKLMPIPRGTFTMGQDGPQTDYKMNTHPGESDRPDRDEKPVHKVTITQRQPWCVDTRIQRGYFRLPRCLR